jgi:hypothetical protein
MACGPEIRNEGKQLMFTRHLLAVLATFMTAPGLPSDWLLRADETTRTAPGGLTVAEFEKLHKELQPSTDELWRSIPWQVSILEGRELAAKTRKPIFVWVASGEPLGCG